MAADNGQVQWLSNAPRSVGADGSTNASVGGVLAAMGVLAACLGVRPILRGINGVLTPKAREDDAMAFEGLEAPEVLDMPDVSEVLESQRARRQLRLNG